MRRCLGVRDAMCPAIFFDKSPGGLERVLAPGTGGNLGCWNPYGCEACPA